jgi:hypothetical protein
MRPVAVAERVQARSFWKTQPAEQEGNRGGDRIRPERSPVGIRENQIQVGTVVRPELLTKPILAPPMPFQGVEGGVRHSHISRPIRFRAFEFQELLGLRQRARDDGSSILKVRPSQCQKLAAARTRRSSEFQECG